MFIKRKTRAGKTYAYRILLSLKTSATSDGVMKNAFVVKQLLTGIIWFFDIQACIWYEWFETIVQSLWTNKFITIPPAWASIHNPRSIHTKQKGSLETRAMFSWILILTRSFGDGQGGSEPTFFKIANASCFWCY